MKRVISPSGSDHHWPSPCSWSSPSIDASAGLWRSPSISSTFELLRLASVNARFPETRLLPSLVEPLVTCSDFSPPSFRKFSIRVARTRNFSAPKLKGSVSATKCTSGDTRTVTERGPPSAGVCGGALFRSEPRCQNAKFLGTQTQGISQRHQVPLGRYAHGH